MTDTIETSANKPGDQVKIIRFVELLAFTENPSERFNGENENNLGATNLFSIFTADIIKQEINVEA